MKTFLLTSAILFSFLASGQQVQFINGSFEQNNVVNQNDTNINNPNSVSYVINDVYGQLGWHSISSIIWCSDSVTAASHGSWFFQFFGTGERGPGKQSPDFAMALDNNLAAGTTYSITFDGNASTGYERVLIGTSNDTAQLGTIHDSLIIDTTGGCWNPHSITVTPGSGDSLITFRIISSDFQNWPTIAGMMDDFQINQVSGMEEKTLENDLKIVPNPAQSSFIVRSSHKGLFTIHDITGKTVRAGRLNQTLNMEAHPEGMYFIRYEANGKVINKKLVISR